MKHGPSFVCAAAFSALVLGVSAFGFDYAVKANDLHLTKKEIYPEDAAGKRIALTWLPDEFPGWTQVGQDEQLSAEMVKALGTDNSLSRWYVETDPAPGEPPRQVQLHAAYYTGTIDTVPHVPDRCYVAAGMKQSGATGPVKVPITIDGPGGMIKNPAVEQDPDLKAKLGGTVYMKRGHKAPILVNMPVGIDDLTMMVTQFESADGNTLYAGYFFVANGGTVASAQRVRTLAYTLESDYAFYCKVQFMSPTVENREEFAQLAAEVLDEIMGDIMYCVPDWVQVARGEHPAQLRDRAAADQQD